MYSPKIDENLIPILYRLKQQTKKPMTILVNEALIQYLHDQVEIISQPKNLKGEINVLDPDYNRNSYSCSGSCGSCSIERGEGK